MSVYLPRNFNKGSYYYVYNQGINSQDIFLDDADFIYYLNKLRQIKDKFRMSIIGYCLLPNHIHLIIKQESEMPISKVINCLHLSYCVHFNKKYNRTGHLFQGRFKHRRVKNENLLKAVSYIHFRPLSSMDDNQLENYQWSSYPDYVESRNGTLCDKKAVIKGLAGKNYRKFSEENFKKELIDKDIDKLIEGLE